MDPVYTDDQEIAYGQLSAASGRRYPITGGVPVLLLPAAWAEGQGETRKSFSEKWKRARNYREATRHHYAKWYLERYGLLTLEGLRAFLAPKRRILDAGTGHGRDAEWFSQNSAGIVFGIDISTGIYNAYRDLHHIENLHFAQADLTRLPFPEGFFDFISCDQVIHHTPNVRESLHALLRHLVPGGHIAIYVYKKKGPVREFCDDYIRKQTVGMPPDECMRICESITKFGKALSDLRVEIEVPEDIPVLEIKAGRYDLQRFIYWNMFKCYWNDTIDWDNNTITNFDWYHPFHAHRHTPEEVRGWCESAGLEIVHFDVVESGISVLGRKRA
ncbi:MAG TPA: class I SAM-dependent methyltransferase [Candidatus Acidoferrum sp.]|nr:class I SAM-dependent methyltransferase [Candidatus Acidoferrum sp.]